MNSLCPRCGASLSPEANFCAQCGTKIKDLAPSTSLGAQIRVYLIALFIPPFGLWYAYKYFKHGGETDGFDPFDRFDKLTAGKLRAGKLTTSKRIGYVCLILTIVAVYLLIVTAQAFINAMNQSLNNSIF